MKIFLLVIAVTLTEVSAADAQIKQAVQLATLSPTIMVIYNDDLENYQKNHYMLSTIGYFGTYMITDCMWKSAFITLMMGAMKELIYDRLLEQGEPLWDDMKWNTLGVTQGAVFTVSLKF